MQNFIILNRNEKGSLRCLLELVLSFKLNSQFKIIAANVAVPIPPKMKLPNNNSKFPAPKIMVTEATIRFYC